MKMDHNDSGFTLIEMLIVLLVMSVLSLALANFIASWLQTQGLVQTRTSMLSDAESGLDKVSTDIKLSGSVDQTNRWPDPNGPGGNQYGWSSGSQTLVLAVVAKNSSGNPIFTDANDYITLKDDEVYYLSGTTLYRRTISSGVSGDTAITTCPPSSATPSCPADMTVATGVTNWSVSYYDANNNSVSPADARSVQLSITLSTPYDGQNVSASYTTRMVFRNV